MQRRPLPTFDVTVTMIFDGVEFEVRAQGSVEPADRSVGIMADSLHVESAVNVATGEEMELSELQLDELCDSIWPELN